MSRLFAQPIVTSAIAGTTRPEQVQVHAQSAMWKLAVEDMTELSVIGKWR